MNENNYASLESQFFGEECFCEDTEEIFWLRELDDYSSKLQLGNLLSRQYRFREAITAYREAEMIRADSPALYLALGGAYLTLRDFSAADIAYQKCLQLGADSRSVSFPMGVSFFLRGDYPAAANRFSSCLPCSGENHIAALYWNAISSMKGKLEDELLTTYSEEMDVGHHTAYRLAVEVFLGKVDPHKAARAAEAEENDLSRVFALYGIACFLESSGRTAEARQMKEKLMSFDSVWPSVAYLAAWNDLHFPENNNIRKISGNFT